MTREDKAQAIEDLKQKLSDHEFFYLTDSSKLTVKEVNEFRALCHENEVEMKVVKNTLAIKALEDAPEEKGYAALKEFFAGPTAILFTRNANSPAKILKQFRSGHDRPILKAAYIDTDLYSGDGMIQTLVELKSKEDLIGEIIGLLQSPMKNLVSALKSGGSTIAGIVKALEDRESDS